MAALALQVSWCRWLPSTSLLAPEPDNRATGTWLPEAIPVDPSETNIHERGVRHVMLTNLISQIHLESRGTYGDRRVHA